MAGITPGDTQKVSGGVSEWASLLPGTAEGWENIES